MKMVKRVVSIEAGVWWTKVALADYRKKNPPVHKAFAFRTPEHAVEDGYIRDKEAFASALKAELSRHDIHEKEVVFTLSSSKVVTREVMIPFVKDNKIMGIIEAQIRDYFPMDVSNYTISYSKMDVEEEDGKKMLKLLLVAIPDNLLNNYLTISETERYSFCVTVFWKMPWSCSWKNRQRSSVFWKIKNWSFSV